MLQLISIETKEPINVVSAKNKKIRQDTFNTYEPKGLDFTRRRFFEII